MTRHIGKGGGCTAKEELRTILQGVVKKSACEAPDSGAGNMRRQLPSTPDVKGR